MVPACPPLLQLQMLPPAGRVRSCCLAPRWLSMISLLLSLQEGSRLFVQGRTRYWLWPLLLASNGMVVISEQVPKDHGLVHCQDNLLHKLGLQVLLYPVVLLTHTVVLLGQGLVQYVDLCVLHVLHLSQGSLRDWAPRLGKSLGLHTHGPLYPPDPAAGCGTASRPGSCGAAAVSQAAPRGGAAKPRRRPSRSCQHAVPVHQHTHGLCSWLLGHWGFWGS